MSKPELVFQIDVKTTPEKLWEAITHPDFTRRYFYATAVRVREWKAGARFVYDNPDGSAAMQGDLLEVDFPRKLVMSATFLFDADAAREEPGRLTWEIVPAGDHCKLVVTHEFATAGKAHEIAKGGWSFILEGLARIFA